MSCRPGAERCGSRDGASLMCGQYDDPTFDPALFDGARPDSTGPLPPLTAVSADELARHRASFDDFIDGLPPRRFADVRCVYCGNLFEGERDDIACSPCWEARGGKPPLRTSFRPCVHPGCGESPARHNHNNPDSVRHDYL